MTWVGEGTIKAIRSFTWFSLPDGSAIEYVIDGDSQEEISQQCREIVRKIEIGELPEDGKSVLGPDGQPRQWRSK